VNCREISIVAPRCSGLSPLASALWNKLSPNMARRRYKMHHMDHELASRELIRALRGNRSQEALRRRLGRSSNVLHA
jgi:hypothetical protein